MHFGDIVRPVLGNAGHLRNFSSVSGCFFACGAGHRSFDRVYCSLSALDRYLNVQYNEPTSFLSMFKFLSREFYTKTISESGVSLIMYQEQSMNGMSNTMVLQGIPQNDVPLYPLKFRPLFKDYIWGGRNLERLGKALPKGKVAESWEISTHQDGLSVIANGPYQGHTLRDLIVAHAEAVVGTVSHQAFKDDFPLLLKFIDANDWLSVQVHPDDSYAATHERDAGKTEAWLVLDAEPDAMIIYGLNQAIDRDQLAAIIREGRLNQVLNYRKVKKGDVIYIPAGTIHAAGKGLLLAEVQQNSNTTYRLYDYDRKNPDGTTRPLHIEKALDVIDFGRVRDNGLVEGLKVCPKPGLCVEYLVGDPHFFMQRLTIEEEAGFIADGRSFHALIIIAGQGELVWENGTLSFRTGESILVPAKLGSYRIKGRVTILKAFIGEPYKDIMKPLLEAGYSLEAIQSKVAGIKPLA